MTDHTIKQPSIKETAFACPHCGAFTSQFWYKVRAKQLNKGDTPFRPDDEFIKGVEDNPEIDEITKKIHLANLILMGRGEPYFRHSSDSDLMRNPVVEPLNYAHFS